jgi:SdrD B-like domain/Prealbumin-like fold domain
MTIKKSRTRLVSAGLASLMLLWQLGTPAAVSANNWHQNDDVTICHATGSDTNPFVKETVSEEGVVNGHLGDGHQNGEDIVPPFYHQGQNYSQNWDDAGRAIWHNDCRIPKGEIEVNKKVDTDGDGHYEGGNTTANQLGFRWGLDNESANRTMGSDTYATVGQHTITENSINGYVFTGWYYSDDSYKSCANPRGTTLPVTVEVEKHKTRKITLCNKILKGSITIVKDAQPNSDQNFYFEIDKKYSQWDENFTLDDDGNNYNYRSNSRTFEKLSAGTYVVTEAAVNGWNLSDITCSEDANVAVDKDARKATITLAPGDNVTCTFVNQKPAKLTIKKQASPANGQDFTFHSETLGGFMLDDDRNPTLDNQTTFSELTPGQYTVTEESLAGWSLKDVTCWGTDRYHTDWEHNKLTVWLEPGDQVTCKFRNEQRSAIEGFKFEDTNFSGTWDEEQPGLEGWTITLTQKCDEQQNEQTCEGMQATAVTDEWGYYHFGNLEPGTYIVCEEQRAGWVQTHPQTEDGCHEITLDCPGSLGRGDFGNFKKGEVEGSKFNDVNGNSAWDENEPTLPGWTVSLYHMNEAEEWGDPIATAVTDDNGAYNFGNLMPGTYKVCETPQATWQRTFPADSDCHEFVIETSGQVVDADFGNKPLPQVLGEVTGGKGAATLVNTGTSITKSLLVSLIILSVLGAMHVAIIRRKDYAK